LLLARLLFPAHLLLLDRLPFSRSLASAIVN
jgi:hypothetical protein